MQQEIQTHFKTAFEQDVYKGLTEEPKHLSSKYFYDKKGDKLFQDIMNMPEYYLTDAEFDVLDRHKEEIISLFSEKNENFNLIELGAGDGKKTKLLLNYLSEKKIPFKYLPIDISQNALDQLKNSLQIELPTVQVSTQQGTYFEVLADIAKLTDTKKVILFLGSNIGNLLHEQAISFLSNVQQLMHEDDLFFVGFDQKKNPQTILDAYNDKTGITAAFNKNVLARINTDLGGNFNLEHFLHWEVYDPETGTAKSFLVSKKEQHVRINQLDLNVSFRPWETIHTEISQKYDDKTVAWLAQQSGLAIKTQFTDSKKQYKNYVFKKK